MGADADYLMKHGRLPEPEDGLVRVTVSAEVMLERERCYEWVLRYEDTPTVLDGIETGGWPPGDRPVKP